ncbi:MAG: hypothetical protein AMXMBFR4_24880 [Candidatus Hydrogenedentota bacterium]
MAQLTVVGVRERVWSIDEVSTLPHTLVRILSVVQDESATALDLAEEIASDKALTLKILGTVNSSYYGFHRQIGTIADAVVILGFEEIERLAVAISVINMFGRDPESARALHMLWRHSLACSVVASSFESRLRSTIPSISGAHVAGLLHDIGKAVIAQYFPEAVHAIARLVHEEELSRLEAEREVLDGCTHCDIGAWIAERWSLPPAIVESIGMHHTPELVARSHVLTHAAHAADIVCNRVGIRSMNGDTPTEFNPVSAEVLKLDAAWITTMEDRLDRQRGLIGAMAAGGAC